MAESISADFDLLWYLEKLKNKEFQSFKEHLEEELTKFGLPSVSWLELRRAKPEDLANKLETSYEAQHTWNVMFNIFQKIHRKDLCEDISARRNRNEERQKVLLRKRFLLNWKDYFFPCAHSELFVETAAEMINKLNSERSPKNILPSNDFNILLVGDKASGKTTLIKMVVLEWVHGKIWKDIISYVVHVTSREINQMTTGSLVELLSKDWPNGLAPVADILSDPKKLLFILEDLDNINITLNMYDSALCSDSRQQVPTSTLLVSLLNRRMAPGSIFLITSRPNRWGILRALRKETDLLVTLEVSDEKRQKYFTLFFKDLGRTMAALKFVQENEMLVYLCRDPTVCWITCRALNQLMDKGDDLKLSCETLTDVYAHFLANTLKPEAGMTDEHLVLLECLCSLALEGLIYDTLNFSFEDLRSAGFTRADIAVLQSMEILVKSNKYKDHYMFVHLSVQEFCAAVGYMMVLTECKIHSANKYKDRRETYSDFSPTVNFSFGLLNEKRRKTLETAFGCKLLIGDIMQYFLQQTKYLGSNPGAMAHHLPLFYCLFENQEEEFVKQIMGFFLEATIFIQENKDLIVSLYCLKHCHNLQKLKLCVQCIFENREANVRLTSSQMKSLIYWRDICSLLHTRESLRELEISNSDLDDTSERILCKALRHPSCQLQTLKLAHFSVNSKFEDLFKAIIHNQNLLHLSLSYVPISQKLSSLLHEVLENPLCNIRHLSLMKCDLAASDCEEIASFLISNKKLKQLTLSNNQLSNAGVKILCAALLHPECILESLVLLFCCLTKTCCSSIGRVLMLSKTLKHLDLSVNYLQDYGILVLTLPLMFATCKLQELKLSGCFFSSFVCRDIALAITNNQNLKSLELGSNNIGDAGVELLCSALKHPNCKLENLGLEECLLTSACCEAIASVLINNKTLKRLNLLRNELGDEGIVQVLEALRHPNCMLQTVGLQTNNVSAETLKMLMAVKEEKTKLVFVDQSWADKELRKVCRKFDYLSLSQSIPTISSLTWHFISLKMPRKFRKMGGSTTVSWRPSQIVSL